MVSVYHIVDKKPILDGCLLAVELEEIASEIVKSGKLRIDANPASNCVRVTIPELFTTFAFSTREIFDEALQKNTHSFIYAEWMRKFNDKNKALKKTQETIKILHNESSKLVKLDVAVEMKIARIIAQSAHPVVLRLLIIDKVEFFVTYGHSIGDMLDIPTWKSSGDNSGMQSTNGIDSAVFISLGGDPLVKNEDQNATYGDGDPAIARMMIIGAQEMGHFSDIKRDKFGRQIGRYSANFSATKPDPVVAKGRKDDIAYTKKIRSKLEVIGLPKLIEAEKSYLFFVKVKKRRIAKFFAYSLYQFRKLKFSLKLSTIGLYTIDKFIMKHDKPAQLIDTMIADMLFNLEPKADVYSRQNKTEEEAIACVEALARVPQQVVKWGKNETKLFYPNLYKFYYTEVIPGCIRAYETLAHKKYVNRLSLPRFYLFRQLVVYVKQKWKSLFKKK